MMKKLPNLAVIVSMVIVTLAASYLAYKFGLPDNWNMATISGPFIVLAAVIAFILRKKLLAVIFITIILIMGGLYIAERTSAGEQRDMVYQVAASSGIESMKLSLAYGAGKLRISPGSNQYYIVNTIKTADSKDPEMNVEKTDSTAIIGIKRHGSLAIKQREESWDIALSPDILVDMSVDYGAADANIDLRTLKIENLSMHLGATNTELIFGTFPTKVTIEAGASTINMRFPKGYGAKVTVDGGLVENKFPGFVEEDNTYTNGNETIEVKIKAGAATLSGELY